MKRLVPLHLISQLGQPHRKTSQKQPGGANMIVGLDDPPHTSGDLDDIPPMTQHLPMAPLCTPMTHCLHGKDMTDQQTVPAHLRHSCVYLLGTIILVFCLVTLRPRSPVSSLHPGRGVDLPSPWVSLQRPGRTQPGRASPKMPWVGRLSLGFGSGRRRAASGVSGQN